MNRVKCVDDTHSFLKKSHTELNTVDSDTYSNDRIVKMT